MKKMIFGVIILVIVLGCFLYFKKPNVELSQENIQADSKYIPNAVFGKDSENRGFSDEAKDAMEEDLKEVNNDAVLRKMYSNKLKLERQLVLSKSQDEYIFLYKKRINIGNCVVNLLIEKYPNTRFGNFLNPHKSLESSEMSSLMEFMYIKFTRGLSVKEIEEIRGTYPTENECEELKNE